MFGKLLGNRWGAREQPPQPADRAAVLIAPDGWKEEPDLLHCGPGHFVRAHFLAALPGTVWAGWLDDLYSAADVDVAVWLIPEDRAAIVRRLTSRIVGLQAQLELDLRRGDISRRHILERDIAEADALRARVQWGEDRVFSAAVLYTVTAGSREELDRRCVLLAKELEARGAEVRSLWLRQAPGVVTASPAGNWALGAMGYQDCTRLVNLGGAVGFYPFASADMAHPDGVLLGTNLTTGGPVFYSSFAGPAAGITNPHVGIFAQSGAGKTVLMKVLAARSVVQGISCVILDWEREYVPMAENLGGVVVRLQAGHPAGINPFDVEPEDGSVNLADKAAEVRSLVAHMVHLHGGALQPEESAALDRVVFALYSERGISRDPASLYEEYSEVDAATGTYRAGRRRKAMPRLGDLVARMRQEQRLQRLADLLEPYTAAGSMGLFDCETTLELGDAPLVVFDLHDLDERYVRPLAMHVVLAWVMDHFVRRRQGRKRVLVDEAWVMARYPDTLLFLEDMARRARKRLCSLTLASQSFLEFRDSKEGRAVLANLGTRIVLSQKPDQLAEAAEVFQLTEGEQRLIREAERGVGVIKTGSQSVAVRVEFSEEEGLLLAIPKND